MEHAVIERRAPFIIDEAKFSTQRVVTYYLLLIFTAAGVAVVMADDQSERSTMLQTIINFTMLAVGFWLGSSKGAVDKDASMSRMAEASTTTASPIKADDVQIAAEKVSVTTEKGKP